MRLPIGYIEKRGRCTIKKVRDYGYKYHVFYGQCFRQFATIGKAREFALNDLKLMNYARV
jgi:hypothetical protein